MTASLLMGALRNSLAKSIVVNVSLRQFVILNIILRRPISTFCVDVDPHQVLVVPVSFICCG
eukprot:3100402-Prorocentrum_lima.AAC.1